MLMVIFLPGRLFLTCKLVKLAEINWFPRNWGFYNGVTRVVTLFCSLDCDSLLWFVVVNMSFVCG